MRVFFKTLAMVVLCLAGFLLAPFAFPFTLIAAYVLVFAPVAVGTLLHQRAAARRAAPEAVDDDEAQADRAAPTRRSA